VILLTSFEGKGTILGDEWSHSLHESLIAEMSGFFFSQKGNANWMRHILRNCFLLDATGGQMMEVKGLGRRKMQILDNLRNITRY
jgi:hypothetical protein